MLRSVLPALCLLAASASAQDLLLPLYNSDPFDDFGSDTVFGLTGLKGTLGVDVNVGARYDSNVFLSTNGAQDDLIFHVTPQISYSTDPEGGAAYKIYGSYTPAARIYTNNSQLTDINQAGRVNFDYEGNRLKVKVYGLFNELAGSDRFSGGFVEGTYWEAGIRGSYRVAPRTSIFSILRTRNTDYSSGTQTGFESYGLVFGANWRATEHLRFGPSIRFSETRSDLSGTRRGLALAAQATYMRDQRTSLQGWLGVERSTNSRSSDDDLRLTTRIRLKHQPSDRWMWNTMLSYVSLPSSNSRNYVVNDLSYTFSVERYLLYGSLGAELNLSYSDYEPVGTVVAARGSEFYYGLTLSYRRPCFNDRAEFGGFLQYARSDQRGGWDKFQIGCNLKVEL